MTRCGISISGTKERIRLTVGKDKPENAKRGTYPRCIIFDLEARDVVHDRGPIFAGEYLVHSEERVVYCEKRHLQSLAICQGDCASLDALHSSKVSPDDSIQGSCLESAVCEAEVVVRILQDWVFGSEVVCRASANAASCSCQRARSDWTRCVTVQRTLLWPRSPAP